MKYIKFENGKAIEAPAVKKTEAGTIFGYNHECNEKMLLADGWMKYEDNAPLNKLKFENGEIKVKESSTVAIKKTKFTKLQIRRYLRKAGKEHDLDRALFKNREFKKDWEDAQEIDINDDMIKEAIKDNIISEDLITLIQNECK